MQKNKRKNKRTRKTRIIKSFLFIFFLVLLSGIGTFFYILQARIPLYISPLAQNVLGGMATDEDKKLDTLKNGLRKLHIDYDSIAKSRDYYIITLKNKSEVIISDHKNISDQLSSLQFILTRLTMEGRAFRQLDLRFDKPVMRAK